MRADYRLFTEASAELAASNGPNLWPAALAKANAITAAGEAPPTPTQ